MTARNRKRGSSGKRVVEALMTLVAVFVMLVIVVESGAWALLAPSLGLPEVTSVSQLLPGADSKNRVSLPQPDVGASGLDALKPSAGEREESSPTVSDGMSAAPDASGGLPAASASPLGVSEALEAAKGLPVAIPHMKGYKRADQFGRWAQSDAMCGRGTTRDLVLQRDLHDAAMDAQCRVTSGSFTDPYTGEAMRFQRGKDTSSLVQIDHVVALYDAYASGLWSRSQGERVAYANDPEVLLASQGAANNAKGEGVNLSGVGAKHGWKVSTPSVWLPDNVSYRCGYMSKRVYIKHKYGLSMSPWEKSETVGYLEQCAAGS